MATNNKSFNGGNNMLSEILSRNFSEEFVTHMKNAMMMSFFKHQDKRGNGDINDYVGKISITMLEAELKAFAEDGNTTVSIISLYLIATSLFANAVADTLANHSSEYLYGSKVCYS